MCCLVLMSQPVALMCCAYCTDDHCVVRQPHQQTRHYSVLPALLARAEDVCVRARALEGGGKGMLCKSAAGIETKVHLAQVVSCQWSSPTIKSTRHMLQEDWAANDF